jgi:hypothetical protein
MWPPSTPYLPDLGMSIAVRDWCQKWGLISVNLNRFAESKGLLVLLKLCMMTSDTTRGK